MVDKRKHVISRSAAWVIMITPELEAAEVSFNIFIKRMRFIAQAHEGDVVKDDDVGDVSLCEGIKDDVGIAEVAGIGNCEVGQPENVAERRHSCLVEAKGIYELDLRIADVTAAAVTSEFANGYKLVNRAVGHLRFE